MSHYYHLSDRERAYMRLMSDLRQEVVREMDEITAQKKVLVERQRELTRRISRLEKRGLRESKREREAAS